MGSVATNMSARARNSVIGDANHASIESKDEVQLVNPCEGILPTTILRRRLDDLAEKKNEVVLHVLDYSQDSATSTGTL